MGRRSPASAPPPGQIEAGSHLGGNPLIGGKDWASPIFSCRGRGDALTLAPPARRNSFRPPYRDDRRPRLDGRKAGSGAGRLVKVALRHRMIVTGLFAGLIEHRAQPGTFKQQGLHGVRSTADPPQAFTTGGLERPAGQPARMEASVRLQHDHIDHSLTLRLGRRVQLRSPRRCLPQMSGYDETGAPPSRFKKVKDTGRASS